MIARVWKDESGATAIEYALIAGLMSLAVIAGATLIGGSVVNVLDYVTSVFNSL